MRFGLLDFIKPSTFKIWFQWKQKKKFQEVDFDYLNTNELKMVDFNCKKENSVIKNQYNTESSYPSKW